MSSSVLVEQVEYQLVKSVKSVCGKLLKLFKSKAGGIVVYAAGVFFVLKSLSAAAITALLAAIGGGMAAGVALLTLGAGVFSWLWGKFLN